MFQQLVAIEADTARTLMAELNSARAFTDPHLTGEGLAHQIERRVQDVRQRAARTLEAHRTEAQENRDYLQRVMDEHRPRITDHTEAQAAWARVTMYLDNGHSFSHVLANADMAMTLAVEEYGPHHLRAQRDPAQLWRLRFDPDAASDPVAASVDQLHVAVMLRMAELVTDPQLADVIRLTMEADDALAAVEPWWEAIQQVAMGRTFDQLGTATRSRVSEQAAQARREELSPAAAAQHLDPVRDAVASTPTAS